MADYPEWVLKHKKKGTYVNFQNGKYYLYAAHSERVPGTGKVRRVSDGYIGRITEEKGLIPARGKISDDIEAYEYGLSFTVYKLCTKVHSGLRREFGANADKVLVSGLLAAIHGLACAELYETSWLVLHFPEIDFKKTLTDKQGTGAERTARMAHDLLRLRFGEDCNPALLLLPTIRIVCQGKERRLCRIPEGTRAFLEKHSLDLGEV
ncbi:MAG: hypothetical protein LBI12_08320 [Treponema sp.]|jgi:hypothetical protein|nr:hypothetical protein [Treponema sp.]